MAVDCLWKAYKQQKFENNSVMMIYSYLH